MTLQFLQHLIPLVQTSETSQRGTRTPFRKQNLYAGLFYGLIVIEFTINIFIVGTHETLLRLWLLATLASETFLTTQFILLRSDCSQLDIRRRRTIQKRNLFHNIGFQRGKYFHIYTKEMGLIRTIILCGLENIDLGLNN